MSKTLTSVTVVGLTTKADAWTSDNMPDAKYEALDFVQRLDTPDVRSIVITITRLEDA